MTQPVGKGPSKVTFPTPVENAAPTQSNKPSQRQAPVDSYTTKRITEQMPIPSAVETRRAAGAIFYGEANRVDLHIEAAGSKALLELPHKLGTAPKIERWLRQNGFTMPRGAAGSHCVYVGPAGKGRVIVPRHNGDIATGTLHSVRAQVRAALSGATP